MEIKPDQTAVVYCNAGMQASHSYPTLKYLGYPPWICEGTDL